MKKIFLLLLSFSILSSINGRAAITNEEEESTTVAVDSVVANGFKYILSGDSASVAYVGKGTLVTFPANFTREGKTYTVTEVTGVPENNSITTVTIPAGVKILGDRAFYNCKKLTTVTLPKTITSIGSGCFQKCPVLSKVTNYNLTPNDEAPNLDVRSFLCTFYECPKMIDSFCTQLLGKYSKEDMYLLIKHYLFTDSYNCDYMVGDFLATLTIGKKLLVKQAAQGDVDAMTSICNRFIQKYPKSKLISPAEYLKYAKLLLTKKPAYGNYFMGLAYEKGYGVTPSRRQANYYYGKGRDLCDSDCEKGYWRTL